MDTMLLLLVGASLLLAGILISPLSNRIGMPVLLIFLCVGMLAGEDGFGGIVFNDVSTAFTIANLALAIILLDGGMRTRAASFRVGLRPALVLATIGVAITATIAGLATAWLFDLPLMMGLLIGAIISSTDASVVFSLLQGRNLNLNERVEASLEIESGMNDPMAIFLTILLIELLTGDEVFGFTDGLLLFVQQFGIGGLFGLMGGFMLAWCLDRLTLMAPLYPLLVASGGILVFSLSSLLGGSGFLAIYLLGVVLANQGSRRMDTILQIHDGLAWLAQLALFLILGLLVTPSLMLENIGMSLLIAAILILVARPVSVMLSLLPFGFNFKEQFFISWVGLRGAVPIVLALFPVMAGIPAAGAIFQITFVVVLISLLLQGATLAPLARRLKLEVPGTRGPRLRLPLDLEEAGDHELLLFPLQGKRWSTPLSINEIRLPDPARIVVFFRDGKMLESQDSMFVQEKDILAVMARRGQAQEIGRIVGSDEAPDRLTDRRFFGEFTLHGDASLGDIQGIYGVDLRGLDPQLSLSECFVRTRRGHPVVGDRIDLGVMLAVARQVEGDRVTRVGLKLSRDN